MVQIINLSNVRPYFTNIMLRDIVYSKTNSVVTSAVSVTLKESH